MAFGFPRKRAASRRRAPRQERPRTRAHRLLFEPLEPRLVLHPGPVVINELHVNPDVKTELVEYIELYNNSASAVEMSNWYFSDGVQYTIPNGTTLQPWSYLVVSQNPTAVQTKFGAASIGPWTGSLDNDGEKVVLRNAAGVVQDEVDYGLSFPWPTVGDSPGYSMELINPDFDNNLGGNWRPSQGSSQGPQVLFDVGATWKYFKGTTEPSPYPAGLWRQRTGYDDSAWLAGPSGFGYPTSGDAGEAALISTPLSDMDGNYSTLYLRKTFQITDPAAVNSLKLEAWYDDGINVWINGHYEAIGANVRGTTAAEQENQAYNATAKSAIECDTLVPFTFSDLSGYLVAGTNVIAVQLLNSSKSDSSDAIFNAKLTAISGGAPGATPGARNSVYAANAAPQMRQVEHSPNTPYAGQDVTITAKATDPDGVAGVTLSYQLVNPGDYIAIDDARYSNAAYWTNTTMYDDGTHGDATAGDDVYTAVLPGALQTNRRLVRYRITAADGLGASVTGPYSDDPQPNFAYYVYNGVPDYTAAVQPGVTAAVTYPGTMLDDLAVFQLLTTRSDHQESQHIPNATTGAYGGEDYLWQGTLIYDGVVYDHITYRARGGVWRYAMGKNMWKFDFNRGHEFQARDNYGNKYDTKWDKLNLGAVIQQGDYLHRGEQGLFESVGFELFDLAGIAAPNTTFVHFRIVENASESGTSQYTTDFQGLYLAVEQPDGNLLDEHDLPDGNLYKMEGGTGTLNNQASNDTGNKADLNAFMSAYQNPATTDQWFRDNFDLESYYDYRFILEAIHHYDIGDGKNYFYYHNPVTNKWQVVPWDLDLTWANNMYGSGDTNEPFKLYGLMSRPAFAQEYRNRVRELRDLLWNTSSTGAYMLIDEMAGLINQGSLPSMVDADRALWDYNPIMTSSYVNSSKAGQGSFYGGRGGITVPAPGGFEGMVQLMKNYVASRISYLDSTAAFSRNSSAGIFIGEGTIPSTAALAYTGQPGYPLDRLTFQSSSYYSAAGSPFAAMEWRIAAVTDPASPGFDPTAPRKYEVDAAWESGELTTYNNTLTIPSGNLAVGETYRVRVRMKDSAGRWSHWSAPVQFTATAPVDPLTNHLRIAELMYNPTAATADEIAHGYNDRNMFEYIELVNTHTASLTLTGVQFTAGVTHTFAATTLDPGERILVVSNPDAFAYRYSYLSGLNVAAGSYVGNLKDSGATIRLVGPTSAVIQEFAYDDEDDWPGRADGEGSSLEIIDAAGDYNDPHNWRSSSEYDGSPGAAGVGPIHSVVVNEVLTHTNLPQLDFIELYNSTPLPIAVGGWYLSDSQDDYRKFYIPAGTLLGGNQYRVYTEEDYGISAYATATEGGDGISRTEDAGATLHLTGNTWRKIPLSYDVTANTVLEFDFHSTVQGEIQGIGLDNDDAASPGNFFRLYGTQAWGNATYATYAASAPNVVHYVIPVGAFYTGAMKYLTFANDDDAHDDAESWFGNVKIHEGTPGAAVDFSKFLGLSAFNGENLWLVAADAAGRFTYFIDHVEFGAAENGEAFGRWLNGSGDLTPMIAPTPGDANRGPRINPVVFSEIMYAPHDPGTGVLPDDLEYVELYNATAGSISLTGWRIRGGIDFDFAAGATLAAGGKLVVLSFNLDNPANAARWTSFCTVYGLNPANKTGFVGGYSSHLNDDADTVRIERPGDPPRDDPAYTPYLLVEEVRYNSVSPWPTDAGGSGPSLTRQTATLWSNDPASWVAAWASPLSFAPINQPPTDINLSANSVPENSPTNTLVGNLATTDADPGQSWTYVLLDDAGGRFQLSGSQLLVANGALIDYETATSYLVRVRSTDNGSPNLSVEKDFTIHVTDVVENSTIAGRHVFYNRSAFDGGDPAAGAADDGAVAPDKEALLPGQQATLANYTSYTRGINGVMVDIAGLWNPAALSAADFEFKVGNDADPAAWNAAPDALSIDVRIGAGDDGSDRVTIVWADNAVQQQWLQVTVKATANTGLAAADVFYFGNAIGETGFDGDPDPDPTLATVDVQDESAVRAHRTGFAPTGITNVYDFDRDRRVGASDELTPRYLATAGETALQLIDLTGAAAAASYAVADPAVIDSCAVAVPAVSDPAVLVSCATAVPEDPPQVTGLTGAVVSYVAAVPAVPDVDEPSCVATVAEASPQAVGLNGAIVSYAAAAPAVSSIPAVSSVPSVRSVDRVFSAVPAGDGIASWSAQWYWLWELELTARKPAKKDSPFLA